MPFKLFKKSSQYEIRKYYLIDTFESPRMSQMNKKPKEKAGGTFLWSFEKTEKLGTKELKDIDRFCPA